MFDEALDLRCMDFDHSTFVSLMHKRGVYEVKKVDCREELLNLLVSRCHVNGMRIAVAVSHYDEGWGWQIFKIPLILRTQKCWHGSVEKWGRQQRWELKGDCPDIFGKRTFELLFAGHEAMIRDATEDKPGLGAIVQHIIHDEHEEPLDN